MQIFPYPGVTVHLLQGQLEAECVEGHPHQAAGQEAEQIQERAEAEYLVLILLPKLSRFYKNSDSEMEEEGKDMYTMPKP